MIITSIQKSIYVCAISIDFIWPCYGIAMAFAVAFGLAAALLNLRRYVGICLVGQGVPLLSPDRTDHVFAFSL